MGRSSHCGPGRECGRKQRVAWWARGLGAWTWASRTLPHHGSPPIAFPAALGWASSGNWQPPSIQTHRRQTTPGPRLAQTEPARTSLDPIITRSHQSRLRDTVPTTKRFYFFSGEENRQDIFPRTHSARPPNPHTFPRPTNKPAMKAEA